MPRTLTNTELWKSLTNVAAFRETSGTHGSTTLSGAAAVGDATADITATTNFADTDYVVIEGDGGVELSQINGTPATTDCPLKYKLLLAQSAGATFKEFTRALLGRIAAGGITMNRSLPLTAINAADAAVAIGYMVGNGELGGTFNLYGYNIPNILFASGQLESGETGAGSSSDPYQGYTGQGTLGSEGMMCLRATGTRFDGKTVQIDFYNCRVEVNGGETLNRQSPAEIPVGFKCEGISWRIWS